MVDRYRPRNYRKQNHKSRDSSHDSQLFKGDNSIENENVELVENDKISNIKKGKLERIPFKNLVIKQKREKIIKFLMRQDSFSNQLQ